MDTNEHAREALTDKQIVKLIVDLRCGPSTSTDVGLHLRKYQTLCDRAAAALASLSPTTPVDGVGAKPAETFQWPEPKFVPMGDSGQSLNPQRVQSLRDFIKIEMTLGEQLKLFEALHLAEYLASPEAEARLRERVAELEEERDDLLDKLDKRIAMHHETEEQLDRVKAEARLAQAEGGPAVTEAIKSVDYICGRWEKNQGASSLTIAVRQLLAALHPQSAAGEEGK